MKKIIAFSFVAALISCGGNKHPMFENLTAEQIQQQGSVGEKEISDGIKEALSKGVHKEVTNISNYNGIFKNEKTKIGLPKSLAKLDQTFRNIGMPKLSDIGVEKLNHTAEDALKNAKPAILAVIAKLNITDATGILNGEDNAATEYFKEKSTEELKTKITPFVKTSFEKIGAKHWNKITDEYNGLDFIKEKITPDFTDYITEKMVVAIFEAIASEEKEIRNNEEARDTPTLRKVFKIQDGKTAAAIAAEAAAKKVAPKSKKEKGKKDK